MADKTSVMRGGKVIQVKTRVVSRTMTTGTQIATLPKGARLLGYMLSGVASDAATTATVSLGTTSANSNEHVSAADVKTAASGRGPTWLPFVSGIGNAAVPTSDTQIFAKYAESGTASTVGSWVVSIFYTTGNITNDDTI